MGVAQDAATDAQHHWAMAAHEDLERRLISVLEVALQQIAIHSLRRVSLSQDRAKVPDDLVQLVCRHGLCSKVLMKFLPSIYWSQPSRFFHLFFAEDPV